MIETLILLHLFSVYLIGLLAAFLSKIQYYSIKIYFFILIMSLITLTELSFYLRITWDYK